VVTTPPPPVTVEVRPSPAAVSPEPMAVPELISSRVIPLDDDLQVSGLRSRRVTRPTPDEDELAGPPRRSSVWRALGLVLLAAVVASGVMVAGAWGLRMFPEQRQADQVASLLRRANDAMRAERLTRATNRYSVEDITDDALAIEPGNARARQLRRAAAVKLANSATRARNDHHPEQALPLLQDALRLMEDATLRQELEATQREIDEQRPRPAVTPAPRPRPAVRAPEPARASAPSPAPAPAPARSPATSPAPSGPRPTTAAPRRSATGGRNGHAPELPTQEPGVTFTPGRDPNEPPPAPTIPTPFGPLQIQLPQTPPHEPEPAPEPVDPGPSTPHTGEF